MTPIVSEWLHLILRWIHVLAGIAWIGNSFYFMWLDSHLTAPEKPKENVTGELWMVHSGGFYQVEKRLIAPGQMPKVLHWFKWEATLTWVSGIFLLFVVYYLGGGAYLVDAGVSSISVNHARLIGVALLVISWLIYDTLWTLRINKLTATLISIALVGLVVFELSHLFSGRAAFIHVGAIFGTIMVANVWRRILPAQRQMIAATERGEKPDYELGKKAKIRSIHNNYMTFPLIFIMISNHFPSTYGNRQNWIILGGLMLAGAGVRHVMNTRKKSTAWILVPVAAVVAALFVMTSPHRDEIPHEQGAAQALPQVVDAAGSIRGVVHVKGDLPQPEPITFPGGCAEQHSGPVYSNSIESHNGFLKNAFVAITHGLEGKTFAPATGEIVIDQKGCVYAPTVIGVRVGQPVTFVNSDPIFHNVRTIDEKNPVFNEGMQNKDMRITKIFSEPEMMVHAHCDVHPWMNAYIGVMTHPYFAVTNENGEYEINNIPPGHYTLEIWHEVLGRQTKTLTVINSGVAKVDFEMIAK